MASCRKCDSLQETNHILRLSLKQVTEINAGLVLKLERVQEALAVFENDRTLENFERLHDAIEGPDGAVTKAEGQRTLPEKKSG